MVDKRTDIIASLAIVLRVLECFGAETPRVSIAETAEAAGLDRATARRCLLTLHDAGYAEYDGKFFTLTPRALRLGMGALASLPLPKIVQPWLDQLSDQIGQSTSVAILDDTEIVYVARAAQRRVMSIGLMPGSRLPAVCTSMGRVLLATLPEAEAKKILARANLTPRTPRSLTDPKEILAQLSSVRRDGFCVVDQEVELGLRSIAVPLFNADGKTVAALNIGLAAIHETPDQLEIAYLPALKAVQSGIQRILK